MNTPFARRLLLCATAALAPAPTVAEAGPAHETTVPVRLRMPATPRMSMSLQVGENRLYRFDHRPGTTTMLDLGRMEAGWHTFKLQDVRLLERPSQRALSCSGGFEVDAGAQDKAQDLALSAQLDRDGQLRCTIR